MADTKRQLQALREMFAVNPDMAKALLAVAESEELRIFRQTSGSTDPTSVLKRTAEANAVRKFAELLIDDKSNK